MPKPQLKNKMKKGLKIVLLIGLSVLISYCMIDLRRGTSALSFLQGFLSAILIDPSAFFIFTILCLWKLRLNNPRSTALLIAIGSSIEELFLGAAMVLYGERLEDIHPLSLVELIMRYMAIFAAYITFTRRRWSSRIIISLLTAMTIVWMSWSGADFIYDCLTFKSWKGRVTQIIKCPLNIRNVQGETINLADFKGSYLLLDCWTTNCGVCYREFPILQELYNKYKDNRSIKIGALHFRREEKAETITTGQERLQEYDYTFPVFSIKRNDPAVTEIKVKLFPTIIIFDPDGTLIFRGSINDAKDYLRKLVKGGQL